MPWEEYNQETKPNKKPLGSSHPFSLDHKILRNYEQVELGPARIYVLLIDHATPQITYLHRPVSHFQSFVKISISHPHDFQSMSIIIPSINQKYKNIYIYKKRGTSKKYIVIWHAQERFTLIHLSHSQLCILFNYNHDGWYVDK